MTPRPALAWLKPLAERAQAAGLPLYAVGGCVRDWLLGKACRDLDLTVVGDPAPLARACGELLGAEPEAFGQFGTLRLETRDWRVDFAMSRQEAYPQPASLPVVSPASLERDLFRRDFTINAMAVPLRPGGLGPVVDPYGGLADLRRKILRPLHGGSFQDDPTRVFRAARFMARLGLKPAPGVAAQAAAVLRQGHAARLSRHRLAQELLRVLDEGDPVGALGLLRRWGYLDLIFPRLSWPRAMPAGRAQRLGALALALGPEGPGFLSSLPVDRELGGSLREILRAARSRSSPRAALAPWAGAVLKTRFPRLPAAAAKPAFLSGADLLAAGLAPGKEYGRILDEAARRQWKGDFKGRAQALKWLKKELRARDRVG